MDVVTLALAERCVSPITNLHPNGDYSDGTTGWNSSKASLSAADNILTATLSTTPSASEALIRTTRTLQPNIIGHMYYVSISIFPQHDCQCRFGLGGAYPFLASINAGEWNKRSMNIIAKSLELYTFFSNLNETGYVVGDEIKFKEFMIIDLTATFGAGNEPTAKEMDAILECLPASWFHGTINLSRAFRGYLLKEIRDIKTAIVGLGGQV